MRIVIDMDDLKSRLQRTGLIPDGYEVESVEAGAYSKEVNIECKKVEPLAMDRMFKAEGERPTFPLRPMAPCVRDSEDI